MTTSRNLFNDTFAFLRLHVRREVIGNDLPGLAAWLAPLSLKSSTSFSCSHEPSKHCSAFEFAYSDGVAGHTERDLWTGVHRFDGSSPLTHGTGAGPNNHAVRTFEIRELILDEAGLPGWGWSGELHEHCAMSDLRSYFVGYEQGAIALAAAGAALASAAATPVQLEARASSASSGSLPTITTKGNAFFAGDDRFYIRGVDYQPGGSSEAADPIADVDGCKRDVVEFKKLGINTVRVYTVDNTANHDECMSALADAGIYLALDVNTPKYSINRNEPAESYNDVYLQSVFATIDAFAGYSNTLLFFSGNEVINSDNTTSCAPYVKAVTRDMRQYINSQKYRQIPVGYSAADVESNRYEMATYMNCGSDDQRSDFFSFNDYSWCDPSSFTTSGWDQKVKLFSNYSIPLFLSEYGCITNTRKFEEVASIYGSDMMAVYSGALAYEYAEEGNGYGLVTISGDSVTELADFAALQTALAGTNPSGDGGYTQNGAVSDCPVESDTWQVSDFTGSDLPAIPAKAATYMKNGAGTGPGLNGSGSQNAGGQSTGTATAGSGTFTPVSTKGAGSANKPDSTTNAANTLVLGELSVAPFVCTAVVFFSTLLGCTLLSPSLLVAISTSLCKHVPLVLEAAATQRTLASAAREDERVIESLAPSRAGGTTKTRR
nr:1,3-beta-glucanosyltransferase gel1 [Quercus suber]